MGINNAVLRCDRTEKGDETYTPFYAVEPILKYLPKDKIVWCPFDEVWSAYYQLLRERGYQVVRSSLVEGQDFFTYEPEAWDIVVSNPPFSIKDRVAGAALWLRKAVCSIAAPHNAAGPEPVQTLEKRGADSGVRQASVLLPQYQLRRLCFKLLFSKRLFLPQLASEKPDFRGNVEV